MHIWRYPPHGSCNCKLNATDSYSPYNPGIMWMQHALSERVICEVCMPEALLQIAVEGSKQTDLGTVGEPARCPTVSNHHWGHLENKYFSIQNYHLICDGRVKKFLHIQKDCHFNICLWYLVYSSNLFCDDPWKNWKNTKFRYGGKLSNN